MSDGMNVVFLIFDRFINFLFNDFQIVQGVSLGWIIVSVFVVIIVVKSILNQPSGVSVTVKDKRNG